MHSENPLAGVGTTPDNPASEHLDHPRADHKTDRKECRKTIEVERE
jgi:hypothetical protein